MRKLLIGWNKISTIRLNSPSGEPNTQQLSFAVRVIFNQMVENSCVTVRLRPSATATVTATDQKEASHFRKLEWDATIIGKQGGKFEIYENFLLPYAFQPHFSSDLQRLAYQEIHGDLARRRGVEMISTVICKANMPYRQRAEPQDHPRVTNHIPPLWASMQVQHIGRYWRLSKQTYYEFSLKH